MTNVADHFHYIEQFVAGKVEEAQLAAHLASCDESTLAAIQQRFDALSSPVYQAQPQWQALGGNTLGTGIKLTQVLLICLGQSPWTDKVIAALPLTGAKVLRCDDPKQLPDLFGIELSAVLFIDGQTVTPQQMSQAMIERYRLLQQLVAQCATQGVWLNYCYRADDTLGAGYGMAGLLPSLCKEKNAWRASVVALQDLNQVSALTNIFADTSPQFGLYQVNAAGAQKRVWQLAEIAKQTGLTSFASDDEVVVITGGLGGIALSLSELLIENNKLRVALVGRSNDAVRISQALARFAPQQVAYFTADVTTLDDCMQMYAKIIERFGRIDRVIHSAAVINDQLMQHAEQSKLKQTLAVKVDGLLNLIAAAKAHQLSAEFIAFSSLVSLVGNKGQSAYAYSNGFFDDLARNGAFENAVVKVVNWPYWQHGGMQLPKATLNYLRQHKGLEPLSSVAGLKALSALLQSAQRGPVAVLQGDKSKLYGALLAELNGGISSDSQINSFVSLAQTAVQNPNQTASDTDLVLWLKQQISQVLDLDIADIDSDKDLSDFGFDSITLVEFAEHIEKGLNFNTLDSKLDAGIFLSHPSINQLAAKLATMNPTMGSDTNFKGSDTSFEKSETYAVLAEVVAQTLDFAVADLKAQFKAQIAAEAEPMVVSDLGFDSITLVEFADGLCRRLGLSQLSPEVFLEYAEIPALVAHLDSLRLNITAAPAIEPPIASMAQMASGAKSPNTEQDKAPSKAPKEDGIAVIGIAGRFPGAADPLSWWQSLANGQAAISKVPSDRWDWQSIDGDVHGADNKTDCHFGGFIADIDKFDAALFNISPVEAKYMDPQQRHLLEVVWSLLDNAGYAQRTLQGKTVGTFLGIQRCDYINRFLAAGENNFLVNSGNISCFQAGRIAHQFDFNGPNSSSNDACSSSFVALHQAVNALRLGDCDYAVVAAANLLVDPWSYVVNRKASMLTNTNEIRAFDQRAEGQLYGEAVCAVMLTTLENAKANGDYLYGVVRATAVNHDGRSTFLTQPNWLQQQKVITSALQKAGLSAEQIPYIEAQGAAKVEVDSAELKLYQQVFSPRNIPLIIGSNKAYGGHLENVSGLAGLIKLLLSFKNDALVKVLNCEQPNLPEGCDDLRMAQGFECWSGLSNAIAGIHNYGYSGVNSFVVVEDAKAAKTDNAPLAKENAAQPIILSAQSWPLMAAFAKRLAEYIEQQQYRGYGVTQLSVSDIAYSLSQRTLLNKKIAFNAANLTELSAKLDAIASAAQSGDEALEARLANLGAEVYQAKVHSSKVHQGRKVPLPATVFADTRFWVESSVSDKHHASDKPQSSLEIALDSAILAHHVVADKPLLPGAVSLCYALSELKPGLRAFGITWPQPGKVHGAALSLTLAKNGAERRVLNQNGDILCQLNTTDSVDKAAVVDLARYENRCTGFVSKSQCYSRFAEQGIVYGEHYQKINRAMVGDDIVVAQIAGTSGDTVFDGAVLDGVLQTVMLSFEVQQQLQCLPFSIEQLQWFAPLEGTLTAICERVAERGNVYKFNIQVCDMQQRCLLNISEFALKALAQTTDAEPAVISVTEHQPLRDFICGVFSDVTEIPLQDIAPEQRFEHYGINSLVILSLSQALDKHFKGLPRTLFFEYQTINELVVFLATEKADDVAQLGLGVVDATSVSELASTAHITATSASHLPPEPSKQHKPAVSDDIAIIGIDGRYPGAADLEGFWQNLANGVDAISTIPDDRWDHSLYYSEDKRRKDKTYGKWGGFIADVDKFDSLFFNISPREAELIDPLERVLLESLWHCFENAAVVLDRDYNWQFDPNHPAQKVANNIGVFIGIMSQEYHFYGIERCHDGDVLALPNDPASLANRLSHSFNLRGPSIGVNSMCSSSLTAIHLACQSLKRGECEMAVAGGANLSIHPNKYLLLARGNFIASSGRCESFGNGGDGYVPSEGVGTVLLKPLADAKRDGDYIHALIKGSSVNHGGRTSGYTVPNPQAQASVIYQALRAANVEPHGVNYIEAHGTGTALGDPIEIKGLDKAYQALLGKEDKAPVYIGSVKSNIGHCEAAAGVAGLAKVVLQLKHQTLVPSLHSQTLNGNIDFCALRFDVPQQLMPWPQVMDVAGQPLPRTAGISSFGAGGANAHVVVQQYLRPSREQNPESHLERNYLPVSAQSQSQLLALLTKLKGFMQNTSERPAFDDLCYTLQVGRSELKYGVCFSAANYEQAIAAIEQCLADGPADLLRGGNRQQLSGDNYIDSWLRAEKVHWQDLYLAPQLPAQVQLPVRVPLPVYPFAKVPCWLAPAKVAKTSQTLKAGQWLGKLDPSQPQLSFALNLDSAHPVFGEHQVDGRGLFPAAAYLEVFSEWAQQAVQLPKPYQLACRWLAPLWQDDCQRALTIEAEAINNGYRLSLIADNGQSRITHASADLTFSAVEALPKPSVSNPKMWLNSADKDAFYRHLAQSGMAYTGRYQSVMSIAKAGEQLRVQLQGQGHIGAVIDGCLQATCALLSGVESSSALSGAQTPYLPIGIERVFISEAFDGAGQYVAQVTQQRKAAGQSSNSAVFDIQLTDSAGQLVMQLQGLNLRPLKRQQQDDEAQSSLSQCCYHISWQALSLPSKPLNSKLPDLIFTDEDRLKAADSYPVEYCHSERRLTQLLAPLGKLERPVIRYIAQGDALSPKEQVKAFYRLVQGLLGAGLHNQAIQLQVLTKGAVSVKDSDKVMANNAGLIGFCQSLAKEFSRWQVLLVDYDEQQTLNECISALELWRTGQPQGQQGDLDDINSSAFAIRAGQCYRKVLLAADSEVDQAKPSVVIPGGVYVIAGGAGGLGRAFSRYLIERHRARIIWLGRRAQDQTITQQIEQTAAYGLKPQYIAVDISDKNALAQVAQQVLAHYGKVDGVIHSAIVMDDVRVAKMTEQQLDKVLAVKIDGMVNLTEAFAEADMVIGFSSLQSMSGAFGQANYAAGCTFKDAWLQQLANQGRQVRIINWGYWGEFGVAADSFHREQLAKQGFLSLDINSGSAAFEWLLASDLKQLAVMKVTAERRQSMGLVQSPQVAQASVAEPVAKGSQMVAELTKSSAEGLDTSAVQQWLRALVAQVLKVPLEQLDVDVALETYGLDSILAVELSDELSDTLGKVPQTLLFEYQTVAALSDYVCEQYHPELMQRFALASEPKSGIGEQAKLPQPQAHNQSSGKDEYHGKVAIIGFAGQFPDAPDLATFWLNLAKGHNAIKPLPAERWPSLPQYEGLLQHTNGGFLADIDGFDAHFFSISPRDAQMMDPQERLFLSCAWHCLEDAGFSRQRLANWQNAPADVGVFVGVMWNEYGHIAVEQALKGHAVAVSSSPASIANRVSYTLNLTGPSVAIDSQCSSSLSALHQAILSVNNGDCEMALAGGVNLSVHPNKFFQLSRGHFLSQSGRCNSFGADADGIAIGEGVGCALLKPLDKAVADNDPIRGVILASSLNHGAKTNGYTVPNPKAQQALIDKALQRAGIEVETISYVEAHGTGTPLGDPIEIRGLQGAYGRYSDNQQFCALGSVKSNIGHLESAAAMAGLAKILLQIEHQQLAPSLNAQTLNPAIDFSETAFALQRQLSPWQSVDGKPLTAALSSFGAGGANGHLIVQQWQQAAPVLQHPSVVTLSAASAQQLLLLATKLAECVALSSDISPARWGYTYQVGREALACRVALVCENTEQLAEQLADFINGRHNDKVLIGNNQSDSISALPMPLKAFAPFEGLSAQQLSMAQWQQAAAHWVLGNNIDWHSLYDLRQYRVAPAPQYPFALSRHWLELADGEVEVTSATTNISAVVKQLDSTRLVLALPLSKDLALLAQHQVDGQPMLAGAAYPWVFAQACASIRENRVLQNGSSHWLNLDFARFDLTELYWLKPVVVSSEAPTYLEFEVEALKPNYQVVAKVDGQVCGRFCLAALSPGQLAQTATLAPLDLQAKAALLWQNPQDFYHSMASHGLVYGPLYQALQAVWLLPNNALLAQLAVKSTDPVLQATTVLDSALQAVTPLYLAQAGQQAGVNLPYGIKQLKVFAAIGQSLWVKVQAKGLLEYDLELFDADGTLLAQVTGFTMAPKPQLQTLLQPQPPKLMDDAKVHWFIPGFGARQNTRLGQLGTGYCVIAAENPSASEQRFIASLSGHIGQSLSSAQIAAADFTQSPEIVLSFGLSATEHKGFMAELFTTLKQLQVAAPNSQLSLVTEGGLCVGLGDEVNPVVAGVSGLCQSLAKEMPSWRLRHIDSDAQSLTQAMAIAQGEADYCTTIAVRQNQRYHMRSVPCRQVGSEVVKSPIKTGGVYLIVGGSGGLGRAFSQYLIARYQAKVIWFGRSKMDNAIQQAIDNEPSLAYYQADALDSKALERALGEVKARFGQLDGVIHSALVLKDATFAAMDKATFDMAYDAKADGIINLCQALETTLLLERLDWLCLFSSGQGLDGAKGQSNYAGASSFIDLYGSHLRSKQVRAHVINWGFWGSVGRVANDFYRGKMAEIGIGSLEIDEGVAAFEYCLAHNVPQLAVVKLTEQALAQMPIEQHTDGFWPQQQSTVDVAQATIDQEGYQQAGQALWQQQTPGKQAIDSFVRQALVWQLQQLGWSFDTPAQSVSSLRTLLKVSAKYIRLFDELCADLLRHELLELNQNLLSWRGDLAAEFNLPQQLSAAILQQAEQLKSDYQQIDVQVALVADCLVSFGDIITGKVLATDVMFPGGSMAKVEGIYKHNPVADYFNGALAQALLAMIKEVKAAKGQTVRMLEIGAGTGGTSAVVFDVLASIQDDIALSYVYSDISPSFLQHGERTFKATAPYLETALFNVDEPLSAAPHNIAEGSFDVVIATNVLHATGDIRRTLQQVKACLKRDGVLLLNEVSANELYLTLTFGLTDGWWLYQDESLRMAGSPALEAQMWQRVLRDAGFASVSQPLDFAADLGQQLYLAKASEYSLQSRPQQKAPLLVTQPVVTQPLQSQIVLPKAAETAPVAPVTQARFDKAQLQQLVLEHTAKALKSTVANISLTRPLSDLGVDSIVGVELVASLNQALEVTLNTTVIFDHPTVERLVAHLLTHESLTTPKTRPSAPKSDNRPSVQQAAAVSQPKAQAVNIDIDSVVIAQTAKVLKLSPDSLPKQKTLSDLGVDSIVGVELVNGLNQALGEHLSAPLNTTVIFDQPTVERLARYIRQQLQPISIKPSMANSQKQPSIGFAAALASYKQARGLQ